jgi:hypothetical protein
MNVAVMVLASLVSMGPGEAASKDASRLSELARAIQAADLRGERDELRRLASTLKEVKDPKLAAYRDYWQGFAHWRRALNGMNETPTPPDLRDDVRNAVAGFRASLTQRPDWIEPKVGLAFCLGNLLFVGGLEEPERQQIIAEIQPIAREVAQVTDNPRALWLVGGNLLFRPPSAGGDLVRAAATYRKGLEAARREALGPSSPDWVPRWGMAEHLMSLAYLYSHRPPENPELAQAYADGALAVAPDWHYVRDILVPRITSLRVGPVRHESASDRGR